MIKQGLKIICLVPQKFWKIPVVPENHPSHHNHSQGNNVPTTRPLTRVIPHQPPSSHKGSHTQHPLTIHGFQPSYTQKVCHANSPHTSPHLHRNIRLTQGEKLTQSLAYTQSILTHTPPSHQKKALLVVFVTNITPLCRQGMSFTHSHSIITFTKL